jgi:hypothetical protein
MPSGYRIQSWKMIKSQTSKVLFRVRAKLCAEFLLSAESVTVDGLFFV